MLAARLGLASWTIALAAGETPRLPIDTLAADFGLVAPPGLHAAGAAPGTPDSARLALGRALFFDPVLSGDRTIACASCHRPDHGFADPVPYSLGVRGQTALRHTPSLLNRGLGEYFSWTGQAMTLREQVLLPIHNQIEMDLGFEEIAPRLRGDPRFGPAFEAAFGRPATITDTGDALATFVERIWIGDSAVDRFQSGDFDALNESERAGLWLYESKAGCWRCHAGRNYTDEDFHATGVGAREGRALPGRFEITGEDSDRGRFKTPTLRGLALTAPYMHDGGLATLEDVVAFYRRGGNPIAERDERLAPLEMTDAEALNLAAFLRALSR
ncbi:MAG: cytochrome-c peroxidase [Planctomycetota bacterium]|nr:cytochrome-c peroxidase [Planctomycetota bacterium]